MWDLFIICFDYETKPAEMKTNTRDMHASIDSKHNAIVGTTNPFDRSHASIHPFDCPFRIEQLINSLVC